MPDSTTPVEEEGLLSWLFYLLVPVAVLFVLYLLNRKPRQTQILIKPPPPRANTKKTEKSKSNGPPMKIFFGSQTGTAEDFSHTLCDEALSHTFNAEVVDLEGYNGEDLAKEPLAIFVVATYGEGEPTDNAKDFYQWLTDAEREPGSLSGLKFAVFGLGNRTYEHFNAVARTVDERLAELGAQRAFERGEGDDDSSLEEDFEQWRARLWEPLCRACNIEVSALQAVQKKSTYLLESLPADAQLSSAVVWHKTGTVNARLIDAKNPLFCPIVVNRELHSPASGRSCRHVEIHIGARLRYEPGDHLGIFPENDPTLVEAYARRLDFDLEAVFALHPRDNPKAPPVVGPTTVRNALSRFVELAALPRKSVLQTLARFADNESERDRLALLGSPSEKGNEEYNRYIKTDQRIVLQVLQDHPSCKPPLESFLELMPAMNPRFYSISSSLKAHPEHVHVTAVVVQLTTPTGRVHNGVCTSWLAKLPPQTMVPVFVRRSTFHMPKDRKRPIIMIGPGTGLAPFRGFIEERRIQKQSEEVGLSWLFFGCRRSDHDYLYKEELQQAHAESLIQLSVAFSREGDKKVYVQHLLKQSQEELWKLIEEHKAYIYVCGDGKQMAKDVHKTFRQIAIDVGGKTSNEAESFITQLQTSSHYLQDVW